MATMMRSGVSAARPDTSPHVQTESCSGAGFHQLGTASYAPLRSSPPLTALGKPGAACSSLAEPGDTTSPTTTPTITVQRRHAHTGE